MLAATRRALGAALPRARRSPRRRRRVRSATARCANATRAERLLREGAIGQAEYDRLTRASARRRAGRARPPIRAPSIANKSLGDAGVRAPFAGMVVERFGLDRRVRAARHADRDAGQVDPLRLRADRARERGRPRARRAERGIRGGRISRASASEGNGALRLAGGARQSPRPAWSRRWCANPRAAPAAGHVRDSRRIETGRDPTPGRAGECACAARAQEPRVRGGRRPPRGAAGAARRARGRADRGREGPPGRRPHRQRDAAPEPSCATASGSSEEIVMQWLANISVKRPIFATVLMLVLCVHRRGRLHAARRRPVPQGRLPGGRGRDRSLPGAAPRRSRPTSPTRSRRRSTPSAASTSCARSRARACRRSSCSSSSRRTSTSPRKRCATRSAPCCPTCRATSTGRWSTRSTRTRRRCSTSRSTPATTDPRDHRARRQGRAAPARERRRRRPGQHPRRPEAPDQRLARSGQAARAGLSPADVQRALARRT